MILSQWLQQWSELGVEVLSPPPGIDWKSLQTQDLTESQAKAVMSMCKYQFGDMIHDPKASDEDAIQALRGFVSLRLPKEQVRWPPSLELLTLDQPTQAAVEFLIGSLRGNPWTPVEQVLVENSLFLGYLAAVANEKLPGDCLLKILTGLHGLYYSPKATEHLSRILRLLHTIIAAEKSEGRGIY